MGSPSAGAAQPDCPGRTPHRSGAPPPHRLRCANGLRLVGIHAGRCDGDLRPRAPVRDKQVAGARAAGAMGAIPAAAPRWAGQHHRLRPRGQQAVAAPPADVHRAGGRRRLHHLRVLDHRRQALVLAPAGHYPRVFRRSCQVWGKSVGAPVRR